MDTQDFNPNGVGVNNGNFIGLPFQEDNAALILFPVPWDMTVSYRAGTALGPQNILNASYQLDLYQPLAVDAWKKGIFFQAPNQDILRLSQKNRSQAESIIESLESGNKLTTEQISTLGRLNQASTDLNAWVYDECLQLLKKGKKVGLIGGDHSSPFGYYQALAQLEGNYGILQIDAHCDLRVAYEGFTYSHASIFYNTLNCIPEVEKLVQVGIRDFCDEEMEYINHSNGRVTTFFNHDLQAAKFEGIPFKNKVEEIIAALPQKVHISLDIDGLEPHLCPNTGTPVPGGLSFDEVVYLIFAVKNSGKEIIGFDICEVAGEGEWDANVGARVTYALLCALL